MLHTTSPACLPGAAPPRAHLCLSPSTVSHCGPGQRPRAAEAGEEGGYQVDYAIGEELLHGEERKGGQGGATSSKHCTHGRHVLTLNMYVHRQMQHAQGTYKQWTRYTSKGIRSAQRGANKVLCSRLGIGVAKADTMGGGAEAMNHLGLTTFLKQFLPTYVGTSHNSTICLVLVV